MRRLPGQGHLPAQAGPISTQPTGNCGCCGGSAPDDIPVTRTSCLECVEKHVGAAYVLLTETREGYAYPKDLELTDGSVRVLNGKGGRSRTVGLDPGACRRAGSHSR